MTAVLTAVTGDGRGDVLDRLAAARAALTRAENATGLRTRLGGPKSWESGAAPATPVPGTSDPDASRPGAAHGGVEHVGHGGRDRGAAALLRGVDPDPLEETSRRIHTLGTDQTLPVPAALAPLFPGGALARGSVVQASGSTSVLLALAAAAGAEGAWCALAALPHVGWRAAAGAGLALDRVAVVPAPGPDAAGVVGALVDGFDVLVVGRCPALSDRDRRSLAARVRTRGAVLLTSHDWPGANHVLHATRTGWDGIGEGWGHLAGQDLAVRATGRGAASGVREVRVHVGRDGLLGAVPGGLGAVPGGLGAVPEGLEVVPDGVRLGGASSSPAVPDESVPTGESAGSMRTLLRAV